MLLAMVAQFDMELQQMDIKIAFLYGIIEERINMREPDEFEDQEKK